MGELSGKVALVTGGSMGLGRAVAEHFAATGMRVITCAHTSPANVTIRCDVSHASDVAAMFDWVQSQYGRLDVLVCCAGTYGPIGDLEQQDWYAWASTIAVNLLGTMLCCQRAVAIMKRQHSGKIVTLSGGGTRPQPGYSAYNAAKAGVQRFTEALAVELADSGIDVNAVAPGTLDTRMRMPRSTLLRPECAMQRAVDCIAWLVSPESDGVSGRLFSAVWDDYRHLPPLKQDDYRMRRSVP